MTQKIAIQGERGSFAEDAALAFFDAGIEIVFCVALGDLREAIESGKADSAVLPVENTLIGKVKMTTEFLETTSWREVRNLYLPIRQNLIACERARLETIESVESHPAALAQCSRFFAANPQLKKIESENTAASARRVVESRDPTRAAIANARAARVFGGKILLANIENSPNNYTKFVLLQKS